MKFTKRRRMLGKVLQEAIMRRKFSAVLFFVVAACLHAQTITIHLINGNNSKPVSDQNITAIWDDSFTKVVTHTDSKGMAQLQVPKNAGYLTLMPGPKMGSEPNRIAYLDCNGNNEAFRISVEAILQSGYEPTNRCSKKTYQTIRPGQLVFYAGLRPWYMPDMQ
jgi:hypothetical protein